MHHPEVDHGIHLDGDIIPSDDVLRGNIHHHRPEAYFNHPVNERDNEEDTRALGGKDQPSQTEYNSSFVFPGDFNRGGQNDENENDER